MFSITLRRSAATLGVVVGFLATAGPAGAKTVAEDSWTEAKAPGAWVWHGLDHVEVDHVWGPIGYVGTQVGSEGARHA